LAGRSLSSSAPAYRAGRDAGAAHLVHIDRDCAGHRIARAAHAQQERLVRDRDARRDKILQRRWSRR